MKLAFCTPNYPQQIDPDDYFSDDLPEDGEVNDDQLLAAFELLNEMIRKSPPLFWSTGNEAVELSPAFIDMVSRERQEAQV